MNPAVRELSAPHEVIPMLGLPTEQPAKRELKTPVEGVLRSIGTLVDELIGTVLDSRTAEDFDASFRDAFPDYVRLMRSFSEIVAKVPPQVMVRLSVESLNELEDAIRAHAEESFGPEMTERALFTVFTLRKITPLLHLILTSKRKLPLCDVEKDQEAAQNYLISALVARFCIDCLTFAMANNRNIYPDVLAALNDQMRSVVNAYAWIKQAAELRSEKQAFDADVAFPPLDDDDRQLLSESMRDLALDQN